MISKQTLSRKGSFDAAHRVMNEKMKCFNVHGHTYLYKLKFKFNSMDSIGYAIDFKEIKRVCCQFIDDYLDHAVILNPKDDILIAASTTLNSKIWLMSLNLEGYCNPTAENIAKELFLICEYLITGRGYGLDIDKIVLYETPNCSVDCTKKSITESDRENFFMLRRRLLNDYVKEKGIINYDDRK